MCIVAKRSPISATAELLFGTPRVSLCLNERGWKEGRLRPNAGVSWKTALRAGNVSEAAAAGRQQHRVYGQLGTVARHLQPVFPYRATDTIPAQAMSHGRVSLRTVPQSAAMCCSRYVGRIRLIIMAALRSRCGRNIFVLRPVVSFFFLSFFSSPISAAADWMSTILPHMM